MKIIEIEDKIKLITGTDIDGCDKWLDDSLKKVEVTKLLYERQHLLNDLFVTDEKALLRFREINERLFHALADAGGCSYVC